MHKLKVPLLLALSITLLTKKGYTSDSTRITFKKNIGFITFGGKENFGSVNYEHIFSIRRKLNWSYSIGVQPFELSRKFSLPVSINTFTKGSLHHFEVDVTGIFYMDKFHPYNGGWKEDFNKQLYVNPSICYRFQGSGPIVFKTGIGPKFLFDPPSDDILKFKTVVTFPAVFGSLGISF